MDLLNGIQNSFICEAAQLGFDLLDCSFITRQQSHEYILQAFETLSGTEVCELTLCGHTMSYPYTDDKAEVMDVAVDVASAEPEPESGDLF